MERKVAAFVQQRFGPYLVGPRGMMQPLADIVKLLFKEELRPKAADPILFYAAPVLSAVAAFAAFAVVPFGADTDFSFLVKYSGLSWLLSLFGVTFTGLDHPIHLAAADVNVGLLVIFAITSMGVYGIVLAGWASNSKYSLLGGLRSSAQMISYEISYGLSFAAVIMLAGSLSLGQIVDQQAGHWFGFIPRWYIFLQPIGFLIFLTAGVAETNRAPFDFPEAEQELVAGYHTEYSSMSFALFFLAEYVNMVTVSAVATDLFLGGWHGPFLPEWLGWIWFLIKLFAILFFYIWMRWTLPRYRYDQLMEFGWKYLLPAAVINLLVTAFVVVYYGF
jgi:NADH-quinone oxidoreductase subunit H